MHVVHTPDPRVHHAEPPPSAQVVVVGSMAAYQPDRRRLRGNDVLLPIYSVGVIVIVEMMGQI